MHQKLRSHDVQMRLKMGTVEMLIFVTPPINKQRFWVPVAVKIEPRIGVKLSLRLAEHALNMNIERSRIGQGK